MSWRQSTKQQLRQKESSSSDALRRYDSQAVVTTMNMVSLEGWVPSTAAVMRPEDCQTLIRCQLTRTDGETQSLGTAMVKVPVPLPSTGDIMSFKAHAARILNANNTLFESCHEVREAMLKHVKGLHSDAENDIGIGSLEGEGVFLEEAVPSQVASNLVFHQRFTNSKRLGAWEVKSRIGACKVSARSLVRGKDSSELDWSSQAKAVQACMRFMEQNNLGITRHVIQAKQGATGYVLDMVFMPACNSCLDGLCVNVAKMAGNETPSDWEEGLSSIPGKFIDTDHGCKRYDIVANQTGAIMRQAKKVTMKHIENQIMREMLRKRTVQSDACKRLTAQHKGKYIKSEITMQQLNSELRAELTPEEMAETSAWMSHALSRRAPAMRCIRGSMVKNHSKNALEVSTVTADIEMKFVFSSMCITHPFRSESIALELGNVWKIEGNTLTMMPPARDVAETAAST